LFAVLALAAGLGVAEPRPASALNVMLKAEPTGTTPGQTIQLIATTDEQVMPPNNIMIYDRYYLTLLTNGACMNCRSLSVPVTMSTLVYPGTVSYVAVVGTYSQGMGAPGQTILAQSPGDCCDQIWLNPLKLYAYRDPAVGSTAPLVRLKADSGGLPIGDPYKIEFFRHEADGTGARVSSCPGGGGISVCDGFDGNPSAA